jgi:hypothetical protein
MIMLNHASRDQPACPHMLRLLDWPFFIIAEMCREVFYGVKAEAGVIEKFSQGIPASPSGQRSRPFAIIFEIPEAAPMTQQVEAISCALCSVLAKYCGFIAQCINL